MKKKFVLVSWLILFVVACAATMPASPAPSTATLGMPTTVIVQTPLLKLPEFVWRVPGDNEFFFSPGGMAIDGQGKLYVWDGGHLRIQVFDANGRSITNWGGRGNARVQKFDNQGKFIAQWGKRGEANGEFIAPYGIAIDGQGRVYVIDDGNALLQVFDGDGKFVPKFGGSWNRRWAVSKSQLHHGR